MLSAESTDLIKIGLFLLACLWSTQAIYVLAIHCASMLAFAVLGHDPVSYFSVLSAIYCAGAVANIRISTNIRYVLWLIAAIHFAEAIDYYLFSYQTTFGTIYPYLIHMADAVALIFLCSKGGRDFGILKCARSFLHNRRNSAKHHINQLAAALYLPKTSVEQTKE